METGSGSTRVLVFAQNCVGAGEVAHVEQAGWDGRDETVPGDCIALDEVAARAWAARGVMGPDDLFIKRAGESVFRFLEQ